MAVNAQETAMKERAADESLSEETREYAKKAVEVLVSSELLDIEQAAALKKLDAMLKMGASKPWPDALQVFTGTREMSGGAMLRYFAPLTAWLKKQNAGADCGW